MKPQAQSKFYELLDFAKQNNLAEIVWKENGLKIAFRRGVNGVQKPSSNGKKTEVSTNESVVPDEVITSPMVGKFKRASAKDRHALVVVGDNVKPGDKLGVVVSMNIPTDIVTYCAGEISKILVEDGRPVEYGQPIFYIKKAD